MTEEEEWVKAALSDDSVVVDLLLNLHHAEPRPAPLTYGNGAAPVLQLEWSVRQPRSRQQVPRKKGDDSTRASPTTPLSWSGASSFSGGAADRGLEESSKLSMPIGNARSKVLANGETTIAKRSRKKKSIAELKEEETFLLKERRNLKMKLETARLSFEKQRAENESLKRMKLDLLSHQRTEIFRPTYQEAVMKQTYQMKVLCTPSCTMLPTNGPCNEVKPSPPHVSSELKDGGHKGYSFLLPDLNLPVDDDSCPRH